MGQILVSSSTAGGAMVEKWGGGTVAEGRAGPLAEGDRRGGDLGSPSLPSSVGEASSSLI